MRKLSIIDFGAHLLTSRDLDPIYIALNKCAFDSGTRNRWLTAYCAFYSAGFACWASEQETAGYWSALHTAAVNEVPTPFGERWPRSSERRHFRGEQAKKAIIAWKEKYEENPECMMEYISEGAPSFTQTYERAKQHRSVGAWMGFKLVDLVDACMGYEIDQSDIMLFMYDTPRESLLRRWQEKYQLPATAKPRDEEAVIRGMVQYYQDIFKDHTIPHKPGKPLDMFCLETIFCKYQSHLNGHYPLYNDIDEITHGLLSWLPYSKNAKLFHQMMPKRNIT